MKSIDAVLANRMKDLPEVLINGKSFKVGRWTYAISCWYRDTYKNEPFNTPEKFSHVLAKMIPDLLEEFEGNLEKLIAFISDLNETEIAILDKQIAYSIQLSTGTERVKKPINKAKAVRAITIMISLFSMLFLAGMGLAFWISSN